jgi:hypothetical protein
MLNPLVQLVGDSAHAQAHRQRRRDFGELPFFFSLFSDRGRYLGATAVLDGA